MHVLGCDPGEAVLASARASSYGLLSTSWGAIEATDVLAFKFAGPQLQNTVEVMPVEVSFDRVTAATLGNGEDARLIRVNQLLVGLLVPADNGWFLQMGLGHYEAEGLIFPKLTDAEAWVRSRVPD